MGKIERLPPELLLNIAEQLPQPDQLRLRLTCRTLLSVCTGLALTEARLSRLYLQLSTVGPTLDIRMHDSLTSNVTELLVLGRSYTDGELDSMGSASYIRSAHGLNLLHCARSSARSQNWPATKTYRSISHTSLWSPL